MLVTIFQASSLVVSRSEDAQTRAEGSAEGLRPGDRRQSGARQEDNSEEATTGTKAGLVRVTGTYRAQQKISTG